MPGVKNSKKKKKKRQYVQPDFGGKELAIRTLSEVQSLSLPFPESALGLERKVCILEKQCCAE